MRIGHGTVSWVFQKATEMLMGFTPLTPWHPYLQLGGSDQMGNILAGLDLVRRISETPAPCYGLCFPLLTNSEGVKMGKSVGGAIWLAAGGVTSRPPPSHPISRLAFCSRLTPLSVYSIVVHQ